MSPMLSFLIKKMDKQAKNIILSDVKNLHTQTQIETYFKSFVYNVLADKKITLIDKFAFIILVSNICQFKVIHNKRSFMSDFSDQYYNFLRSMYDI